MDSEDLLAQDAPPCEPVGESARKRFAVVCAIILFNQLSGSSTSLALGQYVFAQVSGPEAEGVGWAFTKIAFLQVVVTFLAGQLLDKFTRRSFMLEGMRVILVANLLLALIEFAAPELKYLEYLVIALHMIGFSLSFGPLSFVLATELMHDITYPTMLFWVLIFATGLSGDVLLVRYGAAALFLFFAGVTVVGLFYLGGYLVETKDRSRQ
jgi:MFS transporter, SP family, galactose:H+ symporter